MGQLIIKFAKKNPLKKKNDRKKSANITLLGK